MARPPGGPGEHVYTVAAQTDDAGLLYLTVSVVRTAGGSLALGGYPAFVGAPASGPAQAQSAGAPARSGRTGARDGRRARSAQLPGRLRLGARGGSDRDARVSLPAAPLSLESVQRLDWAPGAGAVLAVVQAQRRARRPLHARLRTRRGPRAGPLGGLRDPDGPRHVKPPELEGAAHEATRLNSSSRKSPSRASPHGRCCSPTIVPRSRCATRVTGRGACCLLGVASPGAARRRSAQREHPTGRRLAGEHPAGTAAQAGDTRKRRGPRWNRPPRRPATRRARSR